MCWAFVAALLLLPLLLALDDGVVGDHGVHAQLYVAVSALAAAALLMALGAGVALVHLVLGFPPAGWTAVIREVGIRGGNMRWDVQIE
jgi:hypothetical protein